VVAAAGAAYAYKKYDDDVRSRHRRENDYGYDYRRNDRYNRDNYDGNYRYDRDNYDNNYRNNRENYDSSYRYNRNGRDNSYQSGYRNRDDVDCRDQDGRRRGRR
jgi:hypothetical protein